MRKLIFFRTDANVRIGSGHLSRCLILAGALRKKNFAIIFIFQRTDSHFRESILKEGYEYIDLEEGSPAEMIERMPPSARDPGVLILDTDEEIYYKPESQQAFIDAGLKLVFFTFWEQYEYLAHLIINQNPMSLERPYRTAAYTRKLLGPGYMIFSDRMIETAIRRTNNQVQPAKNLLLAFGGSDEPDRTMSTLQAIDKIGLDIDKIHIVTGSLYPHEARLAAYLESYRYPFQHYIQTPDMASIMSDTSLAICAGGLTLWELALFEVPAAILSWSERETLTAEYLHQAGLGFHMGSIKSMNVTELSGKIANFVKTREAQKRTIALRKRIDINGKKKIITEICSLIHEK